MHKASGVTEKETLTLAFPVNFAKIFKTVFLQNNSGRLLLITDKISMPNPRNASMLS